MAFIVSVIEYFVSNPSILVTLFLLYVFVFVLSMLLVRPPPGKNPFRFDARKPQKPLVTDQKARDAVIKQGLYRNDYHLAMFKLFLQTNFITNVR